MEPDDFVTSVRLRMPSREALELYGLEEVEISEIQNTFACKKRDEAVTLACSIETELTRLLSEYDCSSLEIGGICFLDRGRISELGWHFADLEAAKLLLTDQGKIVLANRGGELMQCAKNSLGFLNGLDLVSQIISEKGSWQGRREQAVDDCAAIAGGTEFRSFFETLLPQF